MTGPVPLVTGWVLAVDFGTTATAGAVRGPDGRVSGLVLANGAATMPSSVFAGATGLLVGTRADDAGGYEPDRYEPTPKRTVGRPRVLLGDREFRPAELVAAVYAAIIGEAVRQHNHTPPTTLVLTHPVAWTDSRLDVLREAIGLASGQLKIALPEPEFVAEPVAAAAHYAQSHTEEVTDALEKASAGVGKDSLLAVYDLGGGTFDATVLRRTGSGYEVLASGGIDPLGGFDFDNRLFSYLGDTHSQPVAPELWQTLSAPDPYDHESGAQHGALHARVRQLKEDLSEHTQQTIRIPGVADPVLVTRAELETLIRADIEATVAELRATVGRAGLTVEQLTGVYRIGGASRSPLVGTLLDQLHRPVRVVDHPKTVVSLGAATPPPAEQPESAPSNSPAVAREIASGGPRSGNGVDGPTDKLAKADDSARRSWRSTVPGLSSRKPPAAAAHFDDDEAVTTRVQRSEPPPTPGVQPVEVTRTVPVQFVAPIQYVTQVQPSAPATPADKSASPRISLILAAAFAALAVIVGIIALVVPASQSTNFPPGTLAVAGVDPATGKVPVVDMSQPIPLAISNPDGDRVSLELDVFGLKIGRHVTALQPAGPTATAVIPSPVHPFLLAGHLTAIVTVLRGDTATATYRFAYQSSQPAVTTALAISTLVAGMFALAFLESGMRSLRQARDRITATIAVPVSAAVLAVTGIVAAWILTGNQPSTVALLGSAELAAAAGVAAAIANTRIGQANRSRRKRRG